MQLKGDYYLILLFWPLTIISLYNPHRLRESIFVWLGGLNQLISPFTNSNHIKSGSYSENCNMVKEGNEML